VGEEDWCSHRNATRLSLGFPQLLPRLTVCSRPLVGAFISCPLLLTMKYATMYKANVYNASLALAHVSRVLVTTGSLRAMIHDFWIFNR